MRQNAGTEWAKMNTKLEYRRSTARGLVFAAILTSFVLLAATQNFILTLAAILSVAIVDITIIALIYTLGWELGLAETLCAMMITVGLSIGYCVHLAMDYKQQPFSRRSKKMQTTFQNMGRPILSSAISTIGAGAFLFGGQLTFCLKFAICITASALAGFFVSMVFFGAVMHIGGP